MTLKEFIHYAEANNLQIVWFRGRSGYLSNIMDMYKQMKAHEETNMHLI